MSVSQRTPSQRDRLNAKEAVEAAKEYLLELYEPEEVPNLRLEEVELLPDGRFWRVTLSFRSPDKEQVQPSAFNPLGENIVRLKRDFKVVELDAETREVRSMKIREP